MSWKAAALITASLAATSANAQTPQALARQAQEAYGKQQYEECSRLYAAAIAQEGNSGSHRYNAACCQALAGHREAAFGLLDQALAAGFTAVDQLASDADFDSLHADARWQPLLENARRAQTAYRAMVNAELGRMKEQDQADRREQPINREKLIANDAIHYRRVKEMIAAAELKVGEDYYNAALIMQHGFTTEDYELAYQLASRAVQLNPDLPNARWLACAAKDRSLWSQGKPQIYGTQFQKFSNDGPYTMEPFDRAAVSDAQRQDAGVRTLAEAEKRLEEMNAGRH
jgi:hypothetical protein